MLFTELLTQNKLERTGVSHGLQGKMKRYDRFAAAVTDAKEKLKTASGKTKETLETEITKGEENMTALNEEICTGIENSIKNKDLNEKRKEILKKARDSKGTNKNGQQQQQAVTYTVDGLANKIFKAEKITVKEELDFYNANKAAIDAAVVKLQTPDDDTSHQAVPAKKKGSGVVVAVLVTLGLGALAALGFKIYKDNQKV